MHAVLECAATLIQIQIRIWDLLIPPEAAKVGDPIADEAEPSSGLVFADSPGPVRRLVRRHWDPVRLGL